MKKNITLLVLSLSLIFITLAHADQPPQDEESCKPASVYTWDPDKKKCFKTK